MENNLMKRIVIDPKIMVGKPIIKGTRVTVYEIVRRVSQGQKFKDIQEDLEVSENDIKAALMYAGKLVEGEEIFPAIIGNKHEISR